MTATDICIRSAVLALLAVFAAGCQAEPSPFEELYRDGYRELESGNLEVALAMAGRGLRRAEHERNLNGVRAFAVFQAEVLVAQRRVTEAMERLGASLADDGQVDVVRARGLMTRGYAACLSADAANEDSDAAVDLREAARIAAALNAVELSIEVLQRRGNCYVLRDDLEAAEISFRDAREMAHAEGLSLREAQAAGSLGNLHIRKGEFDAATRWLRRSLEVASVVSAGGLRAKTLGNLGWCYYLLGDYERAEQVLSEAETLSRELGYTGDLLIVLRNLGRTQQLQGDYEAANRSYAHAAGIAREIVDRREAAEALASIRSTQAALALERRHYDEAVSRTEEALRIQSEYGFSAGRQRTLLLRGEIWEREGEAGRAAALYNEVIGLPDAEPPLVWEARIAAARLHVQADRPADAESAFKRAFELMETSSAQLLEAEHQLPFLSSLGRFYDEYVDFLVAQGRTIEALQAADESRARLLQERLLKTGVTPGSQTDYAGLARDLDALLLFYWTAPGRSFLWTVTADGVELVTLPEEEALDELVTVYQERILKSRDPIGEGDFEGAELHRLLVEPASAARASAKRVIIVPDGPLHQLNFETLIVPDPRPHYLIEDTVLVRAPSLRLLRLETASRSTRESPSLLVLGDPAVPDAEFPPLPLAGGEVASIAELFDPRNRRIFAGSQAAPSAYSAADPERFAYIHFAAHAQANPVVPLDSAVVLSADDDDEYKLYARDIVSMPLSAELVTLSACRSAGGRTFAGEGLVGLSWSFLSAGARNVIGGLWPVEDASTAELMTRLYRELVAGAEPAVALRHAKLELLRSDTAYRKPYYWAPFVVYASRSGGAGQ